MSTPPIQQPLPEDPLVTAARNELDEYLCEGELSMQDVDDLCLKNIAQPSRVMAPFMWFGGKGRFANKILPLLPSAQVYVEPFAGAASVFWHLKTPYNVEVLNDLDGDIVNLFRVLQDPATFKDFEHRIIWTPYSLDEFRRALQHNGDDPVMRAWSFYVRQNQGFGGQAKSEGDWGRVFTPSRGMAGNASKWRGRMKTLQTWHDRLTRVQIDNRCALDVIKYWDSPTTLFYIDPPYVQSTRKSGGYKHEVDDDFHNALVDLCLGLQGNAVLSGYASDVYARLESAGFNRLDFETVCHAACKGRGSVLRGDGNAIAKAPRTESIWTNFDHGQKAMQL